MPQDSPFFSSIFESQRECSSPILFATQSSDSDSTQSPIGSLPASLPSQITSSSPPRNSNKKRNRESYSSPRNTRRRVSQEEYDSLRRTLDLIDDQYDTKASCSQNDCNMLYKQIEGLKSSSVQNLVTFRKVPFARESRVVFVDLITNGFSNSDRVIEIAAVEMINSTLTGKSFQSYLASTKTQVDPLITKLYQIDESLLSLPIVSRDRSAVFYQLLQFLRGENRSEKLSLVAHNAAFVYKYLTSECDQFKITPAKDMFCTLLTKNDIVSQCNELDIPFHQYSKLFRGCYRNVLVVSQIYNALLSQATKVEGKQKETRVVAPVQSKVTIRTQQPNLATKITSLSELTENQKLSLLRYFQICSTSQLQSFFSKGRVPSIMNMRPLQSFEDLVQKFDSVPCLGQRNLVAFYNAKLLIQ